MLDNIDLVIGITLVGFISLYCLARLCIQSYFQQKTNYQEDLIRKLNSVEDRRT